MIQFIEVDKKIANGRKMFAFFDGTTDNFVVAPKRGVAWNTIKQFKDEFNSGSADQLLLMEKCITLIPSDYPKQI